MNQYKEFAEQLARKGGKVMLEYFKIGVNAEIKSDSSPVTEADIKINNMVIEEIKASFPTHSIIGEEESFIVEGSEYTWICDPIDGTRPFTHGIPISTFAIALVDADGNPVVGVVYDPYSDRMFSATKGGGAEMNGKKISVSNRKLDHKNRAVCDVEISQNQKYGLQNFATYMAENYNVVNYKLNSFIFPSMLVAAGEIDFTIFPGNTAHDVAAVKIIVEEAGGKVTDIFGAEQRYDQSIKGAVVSNNITHQDLLDIIQKTVQIRE